MELEALRKDMVAAMKAKDKVTKDAVSSLISAVKKVAIDEGCRDDISGELVDRVILKELKSVKEQIDTCPESRQDLKDEYQARYDVIAKYAPKLMDASEIKAYLTEKHADLIASGNKGQIMPGAVPRLSPPRLLLHAVQEQELRGHRRHRLLHPGRRARPATWISAPIRRSSSTWR